MPGIWLEFWGPSSGREPMPFLLYLFPVMSRHLWGALCCSAQENLGWGRLPGEAVEEVRKAAFCLKNPNLLWLEKNTANNLQTFVTCMGSVLTRESRKK